MTKVIIRADASLAIGSGHVMRCRTLARELHLRGADITFVCRRQEGDLIDLIEEEFKVCILPRLKISKKGEIKPKRTLDNRRIYAMWLGCSQEQDAEDTIYELEKHKLTSAEWIVTDHYGLDANWQSIIKDKLSVYSEPKIMVIDDLADRSHQANYLLDQNFFGESTDSRYTNLVPEKCCQLLGPQYALLAPEYAQLHECIPCRTEIKRILIFFGGIDNSNMTSITLQALLKAEIADISVDVVLGIKAPHRNEVEELVKKRPLTRLHHQLSSLAGLITRADLSIGACGTTTWERACLKLPSLVVTCAENQVASAEALQGENFIRYLGKSENCTIELMTEELKKAINTIGSLDLFNNYSLTDGWGTKRVAAAIVGVQRPIRRRRVKANDEELILSWANEKEVRANSFSNEKITEANHQIWFTKGLINQNRLHLIATDANGCPIGQIRFEKKEQKYTNEQEEALIAISLERSLRGKGLAGELIKLGIEAMLKKWGDNTDAVAEIINGNYASETAFIGAGFVNESINKMEVKKNKKWKRWRWKKNST